MEYNKLSDYDEFVIRFDGDADKEMGLWLKNDSNWTVFFRGETSYGCGGTESFETKEVTLKEFFDFFNKLEGLTNNIKKEVKKELERKYKKLFEANERLSLNNKSLQKENVILRNELQNAKNENWLLKKNVKKF